MPRFLAALFLLFSNLSFFAQAFPVGHMSINFKDASRTGGTLAPGGIQMPGNGRDVGTEIYYPAVSAGDNVALATGTFPVVVFGHGFVMTYDNYNNIYNELAAKGYIVALPRTEGSFAPSHLDFGKDLAFLAAAVQSLNVINSPSQVAVFNGKVASRSALGGHSMGGGCSFIGAQNNTSITCLFNMAAATSNTGGISSLAGASLVTVPLLMLSGARDCVVDTNIQNAHYASTASAIKFHVISKDLTHCDFGNGASVNCTFGQTTSGCGNTVSNSIAFSRYMNYLLPFLNRFLKEDCGEGNRFMDSIYSTPPIRTGRKVTGVANCLTQGLASHAASIAAQVYPNPNQGIFTVQCSSMAEVRVYNALGQCVLEQTLPQGTNVMQLANFPAGWYILRGVTASGQFNVPMIKQDD